MRISLNHSSTGLHPHSTTPGREACTFPRGTAATVQYFKDLLFVFFFLHTECMLLYKFLANGTQSRRMQNNTDAGLYNNSFQLCVPLFGYKTNLGAPSVSPEAASS